jgi:hypothetical protein
MTRDEKNERRDERQAMRERHASPGRGALPGNKNAAKDRMLRTALIDELGGTEEERHEKLREIARRVIKVAIEGDWATESRHAIKEIWDRLDGKVRQEHAIVDADGKGIHLTWPLPQTPLDK